MYLYTAFLLPLRFGWLLVIGISKEYYLQIFECASFWLYSFLRLVDSKIEVPRDVQSSKGP